ALRLRAPRRCRWPGEARHSRRQQRAALRLHAGAARGARRRPGHALEGRVRRAWRGAHQPRVRLHPQEDLGPMVITLFRNRLRPDAGDEYGTTLARMLEIVQQMPGYIQHKVYTAADGERCTVVEFDTEEHHR